MSIVHYLMPLFQSGEDASVLDAANSAIRAIVDPPIGGCPCCIVEAGQLWPESNPRSFICTRHAAAMVARSEALKSRMGVQHA